MTALIYECTTKDGKIFEVKTLAEARKIAEDGGNYKTKYVKIKGAE